MLKLLKLTVIYISFFCYVRCHLVWENPDHLHPVHGLYVKPSSDGTTGDLYVAASENDGVKSKWLTDQPVNFLPTASKQKSKLLPVKLNSNHKKNALFNEETITSRKRVITKPAIKYAYALPVPGSDTSLLAPYPYAAPSSSSSEGSTNSPCSTEAYSQYFYPYMMSAIASAMNAIKDEDKNDESSPTISPLTSPFWPHPYAYPYQYVMVDPSAWAQSQSNAPSTSTSSASEESS